MSIDPIFWLLAAVGFLALEAMTFSMVLRLVCGRQRGSPALLPVHPLVPGAGGGVHCGQRGLPAGIQAAGQTAAQAAHPHQRRPRPWPGGPGADPCLRPATGRVRLDGVDWSARCATPGDTLTPGQACRVTEIHSTLLIVEPILTESINH